jgi:chromosome segregation ATPase
MACRTAQVQAASHTEEMLAEVQNELTAAQTRNEELAAELVQATERVGAADKALEENLRELETVLERLADKDRELEAKQALVASLEDSAHKAAVDGEQRAMELEQALARAVELQADLEDARQANAGLDAEKGRLQAELTAVHAEVEALRAELGNERDAGRPLREGAEAHARELESALLRVKDAEAALEGAMSDLEASRKAQDLQKSELGNLRRDLELNLAALRRAEALAAERQASCAKTEAELQTARDQLREAAKREEAAAGESAASAELVEQVGQLKAKLRAAIKRGKGFEQEAARLPALQAEATTATERAAAAEAGLEILRLEVAKLQNDLTAAQAVVERECAAATQARDQAEKAQGLHQKAEVCTFC